VHHGRIGEQRRDRATSPATGWRFERGAPASPSPPACCSSLSRLRNSTCSSTSRHNDFSEDTYRTLAAADCAIMLLDSAKGVEPQTIKLFEVCGMRRLPHLHLHQQDWIGRARPARTCSTRSSGCSAFRPARPPGRSVLGRAFRVCMTAGRRVCCCSIAATGGTQGRDACEQPRRSGRSRRHRRPRATSGWPTRWPLLHGAGTGFDNDAFRRGEITPVFFGSALTNFGVEPFLDQFLELAPPAVAACDAAGPWCRTPPNFRASSSKIQANMDPMHRDGLPSCGCAPGGSCAAWK